MMLLNLLLVMALQQTAPPALLAQAMKSLPDVRLLVPASDLREYSQAELQKFGYWPPWLVLDLDRDGRPDVAAVVIKPSRSGAAEFGVIAVHARVPGEVQWIVPLDAEPINGVTKGQAADIVVPLFCVECDANTWLRWSGEDYEAELYAVGERFDIASEKHADLHLYASPSASAKPSGIVAHCTTVTVQKVGGTAERRWYLVETPEGQRGWIADEAISGLGECVS